MTTEQMSVSATEQNPAALEQPQAVADSATGAVAASENRAVADLDLSTPEALREFLKQYPASQAVFADERNAEKQRLQREMQLEQGSVDRATETVSWLVDQLNKGANPAELVKQTIPHVKANENWTRAEMLKGLIAQARALDEEAVAPLAELADALQGDAGEIEKVAQAALNAVSNRSGANARQSLLDAESLDSIPKESNLGRAIAAAVAHETEAELNAQKAEANKIPGAVSTPAGVQAEAMTRQAYEAMTPEARKDYRADVRKRDGNLDAVWDVITSA